jgi:hypothetical protein
MAWVDETEETVMSRFGDKLWRRTGPGAQYSSMHPMVRYLGPGLAPMTAAAPIRHRVLVADGEERLRRAGPG